MVDRQTIYVASGVQIYTGGGQHPFTAGAAVSLPVDHAAALLKTEHVLNQQAPKPAPTVSAQPASAPKAAPAAPAQPAPAPKAARAAPAPAQPAPAPKLAPGETLWAREKRTLGE